MRSKLNGLDLSNRSKLNGLDLFSGIGGNSLALGDYVNTLVYCERDRYAQGVLLSAMSSGRLPVRPIWDDVRTLTGGMLPRIDIIVGGFPCQDISVAGRGAGLEGERSGLFFEIVRLAEETKPSFLFLENVPAIRTRGLDTVIRTLSGLGYDCRWDMLSAYDVGAAHKRERWFLMAYSQSFGRCEGWAWPEVRSGRDDTSSGRSARSSEWLPEPDVGRVVARFSSWLDDCKKLGVEVNAHESCIEKARTKGVPYTSSVREMFQYNKGSEAPSRLPRCSLCAVSMPEMPHEGRHGPWDVGNWQEESEGVHNVLSGVYPHPFEEKCNVRASLSERSWQKSGEQTMEERVSRIRCLGNAVVPAQAKEAFERLMGLK